MSPVRQQLQPQSLQCAHTTVDGGAAAYAQQHLPCIPLQSFEQQFTRAECTCMQRIVFVPGKKPQAAGVGELYDRDVFFEHKTQVAFYWPAQRIVNDSVNVAPGLILFPEGARSIAARRA